MTRGQQEFNKAKRSLQRRIKTAEDNDYIVPQELKELSKISYKTITPQKAVHLIKQMNKAREDVLRRQLRTEEGIITGLTAIEEYKRQKKLEKKYDELDNLKLGDTSRKYEKGGEKVGRAFVSLAKRKDEYDSQKYSEAKDRLRLMQQNYWGAANFFKGAMNSFSDGYMNESKLRFANVLKFMKTLNVSKIGDIIKWMDDTELELLNTIYNSDDVYEENDGIMARDILKLEEYLKNNYGYKPLSKRELKDLSNISVQRYENEHGPIQAYNASVMKRQMEMHQL